MLEIATGVDSPDNCSQRSLISSENIKGTKLACRAMSGSSNSLASSYPYPLPPNVGIEYEEKKHHQLFCINSSKDILQMLLTQCSDLGVELRTSVEIQKVLKQAQNQEQRLELETNR